MASKPDNLPIWDETEERVTQPDVTRQQTGFIWSGTKFEKPKGEHFNWLFNNVYKWVKYFDEVLNINALTEKTTLNANDEFLIEDSEDSNAKKKAKLSSLADLISIDTNEISNISYKSTPISVTSWSYTGTTITLTVASHSFLVDDHVEVSGLTATTYPANGVHKVTSVTATTIEYELATTPTGTAGVSSATVKGFTTINDRVSESIGVNQTWQDVTASRSSGVTYTNSTGKPILVIINGSGTGSGTIVVNGITLISPTTNIFSPPSFIVPNGQTYSVSWGFTKWSELR